MDERVKEFRKIADAFRAGKGARPTPYPERCRKLAVDYAQDRLAAGATMTSISKTLGVYAQTLENWRKRDDSPIKPVRVSVPKSKPKPKPKSKVKPDVAPVVAAGVRPRPVLVMPSGARIEGLDVAGVITVLEALG